MKNVGIGAIVVGVLIIVLTLVGILGQTNTRTVMVAAVVLLAVGWFLYRRGARKRST